jgi:hypothetical protein
MISNNKEPGFWFKFFGWIAIALVYTIIFLTLLSLDGCASIDKQIRNDYGRQQKNTDWYIDKDLRN